MSSRLARKRVTRSRPRGGHLEVTAGVELAAEARPNRANVN